jgi:hypothetical protein
MAPHFVPGDRQSVSYRKSYASRDDEGCDPDGQDITKKGWNKFHMHHAWYINHYLPTFW